MKNSILQKILIIALLAFTLNMHSQNWQSLNGGTVYPILSIFGDTINNKLYATGLFNSIGGISANHLAYWNGASWDSIGNGFPNAVLSSHSFTMYNNNLICANTIFSPFDIHVGKLNGTQWDSVGANFKGVFRGVITLNNELYAYGTFDSINHIYYNSIAKWDGQNWISLGFPFRFNDIDNPIITSVALYNNELYVGGAFSDVTPHMVNIAKYDGTTWSVVGEGFSGSMDEVVDLEIYKGELYAAGAFNMNDGNAYNFIARWNGTEWHDVGGGVTSTGNGQIHDLLVLNDKLYAAGVFTEMGGIPAAYIAAWDGTNWCSLGNTPTNSSTVHCLATINDDLYIACGNIFGGDTVNRIAKWIGGNYVDTCGNTTGINEIAKLTSELIIYPNPATNQISIEFTKPVKDIFIEIKNILGETVYSEVLPNNSSSQSKTIDVATFSNGLYFLQIQSETGILSKKFIKQ